VTATVYPISCRVSGLSLMWILLREISMRHARAHAVRTLLVVLGIALGVCLWVAMLATNDSLLGAFEGLVTKAAGKAQLSVSGSEAGIPMDLTSEIASVPGVAHAAPVLEELSRLPDGEAILLVGLDLLGDPYFSDLSLSTAAGSVDPLAFVNDPTAIIITRELAARRSLSVGDSLRLATAAGAEAFTVRGIVAASGMLSAFDGQVAVLFLDALQLHFARGEAVDRIDVGLAPGASSEAVRAGLDAALHGVARAEPALLRSRELAQTLGAFRQGLLLSGLSALLVSAFLVYNAVAIAVVQRRKELGVLRALGVRRRDIRRLFALEGALLGAVGGVLGVLAAGPLARFVLEKTLQTVDRLVMALGPADGTPSFALCAWGVVSGVACALVAAYLPAREASRIEPAQILSGGRAGGESAPVPLLRLALAALLALALAAIASRHGGLAFGVMAVVLLTLGLVCLTPWGVRLHTRWLTPSAERWLGIPGRIAVDSVDRGLARSSITVAALMLAVSISVSVSTWLASLEGAIVRWVDDAFPAHLMVTSGSPLLDQHHLPIAESTLEVVRRIPGIAAAYGVRSPDQKLLGRRVQLMSLDTRLYLGAQQAQGKARMILEGPDPLPVDILHSAPRVLVAENLARRLDLHPGSHLTYDTPSGPRAFEVIAVVRDFSSPEGWVLCDRRFYRDAWHDTSLDQIDVMLSKGADRSQVASAIRAALPRSGSWFVMDHAAFKAEILAATRRTFAYARAPEWITLLVALLGVLASAIATCLDRSREVGLLRAVGATRRQVVTSIVAETGFLGLAAATLGVLAGVPQGLLLVKVLAHALSGWEIGYCFPALEALRASAMVIGIATLAAILPARRLASLDVPQAIALE